MAARDPSGRKVGRNDPCWCGSGRKFKFCHYERDKQKPIESWEAANHLRHAFSKLTCSAPQNWKGDCSGQIVKAHTVPKSACLSVIAKDGHVYSFVPTLENISKHNGVLHPTLVGINRASTFTGFCAKHDNEIFLPIEKQPFNASVEQCFLLGYRALMRECYTKKAQAELMGVYRDSDRGKSFEAQVETQTFTILHEVGVASSLRDNHHYTTVYSSILESRDFTNVSAFVLQFQTPPPVMCSAAIFPEQDFAGTKFQDLGDITVTPELICFSSYASEGHGYVVFTWVGAAQEACRAVVETLDALSDDQITSALIRFFFEFTENVHISPRWWESFSPSQRTALIRRMTQSAMHARQNGCLLSDGISFAPWQLVSRSRIGLWTREKH